MKETGMLERLAAFWKAGAPELGGSFRLLLPRGGQVGAKSGGAQAAEEKGVPFLRKERDGIFSGTKPAGEGRDAERKMRERTGFSLAAAFRQPGKGLFGTEETTWPGQQQTGLAAFAGGAGKTAQGAETRGIQTHFWMKQAADVPMAARAFLWEAPENTGQKSRPIAFAGGMVQKREHAEEPAAAGRKAEAKKQDGEAQVFWKKEERAAKQRQAALPDIDGLMREMTRRLWEEREGCGRRLGG